MRVEVTNQLCVINAGVRSVEVMKEHALLQCGQRINILNATRNSDLFQSRLVQFRQREIGRRINARALCGRMDHQRSEVIEESCCQSLYSGPRVRSLTVGPLHSQPALPDASLNLYRVASRRVFTARWSDRL